MPKGIPKYSPVNPRDYPDNLAKYDKIMKTKTKYIFWAKRNRRIHYLVAPNGYVMTLTNPCYLRKGDWLRCAVPRRHNDPRPKNVGEEDD